MYKLVPTSLARQLIYACLNNVVYRTMGIHIKVDDLSPKITLNSVFVPICLPEAWLSLRENKWKQARPTKTKRSVLHGDT